MKKNSILFVIIVLLISLAGESCKQKGNSLRKAGIDNPFDSALVAPFFSQYSELKKYEKDLTAIYRNYKYSPIWFDEKGLAENGQSLYSLVKGLDDEGISIPFPYQKNIGDIFSTEPGKTFSTTDVELMLTSLYLFYADKVYKGIDNTTITSIEWFLPRKKVSYSALLDAFISDPGSQNNDSLILFSQYYKLRDALKHYRNIEKKGGWAAIDLNPDIKAYELNDTAFAIQQIRDRLFITGDLAQNKISNKYDADLEAAVKKYQVRNGFKPVSQIKPGLIQDMNIPVGERIKILMVNMERCRWISPETFNAKEFIFANIPSYEMTLIRDGKIVFDSPVVVGDSSTKTVIFSGKMSYIVFSPYWNLPKSIIEKEVVPGIEKNKNYLENHDMEWNNGQVRQKPGKNNSLGLVKFMFPNSNDIYFHDTPSRSSFKKENRAISHGCIRVEKARELALNILKDDETWTPEKIDQAMNSGKESICTLKNKIPVHIGYFTAWIDEQGEINFYKDVYERDERLAELLFYKD